MRPYLPILAAAVLLALVVSLAQSNTVLNAMVIALMIALAGYGWNLLGGYGGQFSFGHAAFFGAGAYVDAVLQARFGVNAYVAFVLAAIAGGADGSGDRLSQFSLGAARLLFRADHARLRRGDAGDRERFGDHRRRGGHADPAQVRRSPISSS